MGSLGTCRALAIWGDKMANQSASETVTPFANGRRSNGVEQLDAAGQSIVQLLHKAAGFGEANSRHGSKPVIK